MKNCVHAYCYTEKLHLFIFKWQNYVINDVVLNRVK